MKLTRMHWFGIAFGLLIAIVGVVFFMQFGDGNLFVFFIGISLSIVAFPFVLGTALENKREQQINEMFLEFSRNLAESVNTGTPVSKSIINLSKKNFGPLAPYIEKLSNQISLGIPMHQALETFGYDVGSPVISRAIALIMEAERAGGEIDYILDSVAKSIAEVEKLKKERKASIYNLVVQGYIIFFIFIGIMLVMEFKILPLTATGGFGSLSGLSNVNSLVNSGMSTTSSNLTPEQFSAPFLYLLITQGLFTGLTIGKLSEGSVKAGIKHSFILAVAALLISTGARLLL